MFERLTSSSIGFFGDWIGVADMRKLKLAIAGGLPAFASLGAFAQGTEGDEAVSMMEALQDTVTDFISSATPVLTTVLTAAIGIVLAFVGYKIVRRGTNKV